MSLPRVLPLTSVLGHTYTAWTCHISLPTLDPRICPPSAASVFLTNVHTSGRMSPVQVPSDYATLPRFGLAAFHQEDEVQALRLFSEPMASLDGGGGSWEIWISALMVAAGSQTNLQAPNPFCPQISGAFYLAAHAVPPPGGGAVVPLHAFVLPSILVGPDSLLHPEATGRVKNSYQ